MIIDPSTNVGRLRLRVADWGDIPWIPDSVYEQTLIDTNNNLPKSASTIAYYILGILSSKTHRKLQQLEVYGNNYFDQYLQFIKQAVLNPNNLSDVNPLPYSPNLDWEHPIEAFIYDWNHNYSRGTQSQQMAAQAWPRRTFSPTDPNAPLIWDYPAIDQGEGF